MKLQGTIIIPDAKLTQYLLVLRPEDDKSKFLAQAGFTQENPDQLKQAIFSLVQTYDAVSDRQDKYGGLKAQSLAPRVPCLLLQCG